MRKNRRPRRRREIAHAFGRTLRELRAERGLSQARLARLAGMDGTYPSLMERGLRTPTLYSLAQIAAVFGITVTQLMERVERGESWGR
jgi:transcriptional regulator with XRE-family HTH domain